MAHIFSDKYPFSSHLCNIKYSCSVFDFGQKYVDILYISLRPTRQPYKLGICFSFTILPLCPFAKSICLEKAFRKFNYGNNSSLAFTQVYSIVLKCKVREAVRKVYPLVNSLLKEVYKMSISGSRRKK